jgi:hypothetical protein
MSPKYAAKSKIPPSKRKKHRGFINSIRNLHTANQLDETS